VNTLKRGQSTLEWVIGAAIILGTLVVGIMAWNNGLVAKIGQMVQRLSQTVSVPGVQRTRQVNSGRVWCA